MFCNAGLGGESSVYKPAYILVKLRHWQQFMRDNPAEYTEDELTFYWFEADYRELLDALNEYPM